MCTSFLVKYQIANLKGNRTSDPYCKWISSISEKKEIYDQGYKEIIKVLQSDDFETFYKFFPMKDYCTQLSERQHKNPIILAQTKWFKEQIEKLLSSK